MKNIVNDVIYKDGFFKGKNDLNIYYKSYEVKNIIATIVISHGFCESVEKYYEIINIFNKNDFSVFALDHRGHGKSGRLGIDNNQINVEKFNYYVEDLRSFLDVIVESKLNNNKLFLFAHSMGGGIGALFLEQYNNYFNAAVLSCPMMEIDTGKYPSFISKIITKVFCIAGIGDKYILGHGPFNKNFNDHDSKFDSSSRHYKYRNRQQECEYLQTSGGSFNWLNESFKATRKIVKKKNAQCVNIPILLFQAGKDTFVRSGGQNKFSRYAKDCRLVRIENAKHEIYNERDEILDNYIYQIIEFYNTNCNEL
ncbi:alpha/beta fold hydrolase [Romboutsia faecis]|nr:alpha/beta hydrolase [Romboutsia faecis]